MDEVTPVINGAEHAWVINDPRFPIDLEVASCPSHPPKQDYSAEHLISEMKIYGIDRTVISHVCYYGRNNDYVSYAVKTWPDRFAGIGLLVGHRLFEPGAVENPDRLTYAMQEQGLVGLRLSPIYDKDNRWFDDPVMFPFWERAQELGVVFNIFLGPDQVDQVANMAERFPGVKIVIDHIAMIDITAPDEAGFAPLLALNKFPNVYVRTSLHNPSRQETPYRDVWPFLERLYDTFGPQRLLFANFFEYLIMKELIPFFTNEDKHWILGKTAEGIYFKRRECLPFGE
jgi:predicted TIM-barrel fold metal-dependent hydrolase